MSPARILHGSGGKRNVVTGMCLYDGGGEGHWYSLYHRKGGGGGHGTSVLTEEVNFTGPGKQLLGELGIVHTAVKRGARAQFSPKLSLNKVLNFRKFLLSSPKLRQSLKS